MPESGRGLTAFASYAVASLKLNRIDQASPAADAVLPDQVSWHDPAG